MKMVVSFYRFFSDFSNVLNRRWPLPKAYGGILFGLTVLLFVINPLLFSPRTTISGFADESSPTWERSLSERTFLLTTMAKDSIGGIEELIFELAAYSFLEAAHLRATDADLYGTSEENSTLSNRLFVRFGEFGLSLLYFIAWWFRFFVIALVGYLPFFLAKRKVHDGKDVLVMCSNLRPFFSGIHSTFNPKHNFEVPPSHVTGVVTLAQGTSSTFESSALYTVLKASQALIHTTEELSKIVLAGSRYPSYAPRLQEKSSQASINSKEGTFIPHVTRVLSQALKVHKELVAQNSKDEELHLPKTEKELSKGLARVLTPFLRQEIARCSSSLIATMVLAIEAGKLLCYEQEDGEWRCASSYPLLSSRAVLNSVSSFAQDFTPHQRALIRQALVYGERKNDQGTCHFPLEISPPSIALRQWTEFLFRCHEHHEPLIRELELFAILYESHRKWLAFLVRAVEEDDRIILKNFVMLDDSIAIISFDSLLSYLREVFDETGLSRIRMLLHQTREEVDDGEIVSSTFSDQLANLFDTDETIYKTSQRLNRSTSLCREWALFRVILEYFAWIPSRIGGDKVAPDKIVHAVVTFASLGTQELEDSLSLEGVVPLRLARIKRQLNDVAWDASLRKAIWSRITSHAQEVPMLLSLSKNRAHHTIKSTPDFLK